MSRKTKKPWKPSDYDLARERRIASLGIAIELIRDSGCDCPRCRGLRARFLDDISRLRGIATDPPADR